VTSATIWTVPREPLYIATLPFTPSGVLISFVTFWALTKLRVDVPGRTVSSAYTVRYPDLVGWVTVTFNCTDDNPEVGTPPSPATCTCSVPRGATAPTPERVSNNRYGSSDVKPLGVVTAAAAAGSPPDAITGATLANTPTATKVAENATTHL